MPVIDSHQHFWAKQLLAGKLPPRYDPLVADFGPEDLRPLLDEAGIDQTVLVQTHSSLQNTVEFLQIADRHPWVAAVVGWVDLSDPHVGSVLDDLCRQPKLKGVRHQWEDEADPAWILRPEVLGGLQEVARHGLRYDLLAKPPNWSYLTHVADAVPDLPLVIDHIAKPRIDTHQFDDWAIAMAQSAQYQQIYCKVSGMVTEADWSSWTVADLRPYIETVVELFGSQRVMFGSDWPVCLLAASYARVWNAATDCIAHLSAMDRSRILGLTAQQFYGLQ